MDKPCGRSAAGVMIAVSIAIRLIWAVAIDCTGVFNAAWICPIIGFVLFLPIGYAVKHISGRVPSAIRRFVFVIIALLLLVDASYNVRLISITANVMALGEAPVWLVALPVALLVFICTQFGVEAEGRSARIWLISMIPLLLIMIAMQFGSYKPAWLMPVFGGGIHEILRGGFYSAGCISMISVVWMLCTEDTCRKSLITYVSFGAISASVILLMLGMLSPSLVRTELSRSARIELILSNGRTPQMLQLFMVVLWFGNLLHLLNAECCSAAEYLLKTAPKAGKRAISAFITLAVFLIASTGMCERGQISRLYKGALYPMIGALMMCLLIISIFTNWRQEHAKRT